ncbi:hypothetical protein [Streptomyces aidingensis]|uniref:Uncharacterized protein n=1 Tax=Streptomyces aidingensis TaxID=910347 RepID=A0A1I1PUQ1_9ACTN|nr:hypothetical protein [Streptomyces aidingensis]SFD13407.1 hypothetical protein SAMN05421773_11057 [Streptomyces aidingensis]
MAAAEFPLRVRLYGGRLVHAGRETSVTRLVLGCGANADAASRAPLLLPSGTAVTCRRCEAREDAA